MSASSRPYRLLITAGPTREPVDEVRYLGNRSSGRLGVSLARHAQRRGWDVTLLLGPVSPPGSYTNIRTERFTTTAELDQLLQQYAPECDALIMAAAVADYTPLRPADQREKILRSGERLVLELIPTPDLIAAAARTKRPDQLFIGFALAPAASVLDSAREKLSRKHLDAIIANPLETMDASTIDAALLWRGGQEERTEGAISKDDFAQWLLDRVEPAMRARAARPPRRGRP